MNFNHAGLRSYVTDNQISRLVSITNTLKKSSNEIFLEKLKQNLQKILKKEEDKHILICGDFNYGLLRHEQVQYLNEFLNTIYSNFLQPCITEPIRAVGKNRPTLSDNIFFNTFDKQMSAGNFLDKMSGYLPNFLMKNDIKKFSYKKKNGSNRFYKIP